MPARRAAQQFIESGFMVVALILIFEWVAPWMSGKQVDWSQFFFACIFGMQIIILHTALAYVRPLSKLELKAMVEEVMRADAAERTSPELPRMRQMATWSMNDPAWKDSTWLETLSLPAVHPASLPETMPLPAVRPVPLPERP